MVTNNNTFYHNNFINNQIQAWDYTSSTTNVFDNGKEAMIGAATTAQMPIMTALEIPHTNQPHFTFTAM